MATDQFIKTQKEMLTDLGNRLGYEAEFSQQFLTKSEIPDIEKKWMRSINSLSNYCSFSIRLLLSSIDDYKHLSHEQLGLYIGKIAIQSFLEIINSFEQITNKFIIENEKFRTLIEKRISEKLNLLEDWDAKGKSKKLKDSFKSQLKSKIHEMAFIRDTLRKEKIIDETDYNVLSFAWKIRNSMHMNFTSIDNIVFKYSDLKTGKVYHFKFIKGQVLYHPDDLVSFYIITEQIIFIMLKILQKYR